MSTVQDLIDASARLTRVKGRGRPLTGEESAAWLNALNMMLDSWAVDDLLIYGITKEALTLATSAKSYSIGASGDFNTTRPEQIVNMFIRAGDEDHPVRIIDSAEYAAIGNKNISARPSRAWYNPTWPTGTIYFESKPTVGEKVVIDSLKPISSFANLSTTVTLPPGYEALIKYNLAIEVANEYGRSVMPETATLAAKLMDKVKRRNKRIPKLGVDSALQPQDSFNILTGEL